MASGLKIATGIVSGFAILWGVGGMAYSRVFREECRDFREDPSRETGSEVLQRAANAFQERIDFPRGQERETAEVFCDARQPLAGLGAGAVTLGSLGLIKIFR